MQTDIKKSRQRHKNHERPDESHHDACPEYVEAALPSAFNPPIAGVFRSSARFDTMPFEIINIVITLAFLAVCILVSSVLVRQL